MGKPVLIYQDTTTLVVEVSGRTETSKYPEENKSTEIPLVVANETGIAQISMT